MRAAARRERRHGESGGTARAAEVTISGSIRVDLPVLEAAEDAFQQILHAYEARLDQLDAHLQTSLAAWSGDAHAAYRTAHAQWQAAATDMARNIAWLRRVIVTARQNYSSARSTNIGMWQGGR